MIKSIEKKSKDDTATIIANLVTVDDIDGWLRERSQLSRSGWMRDYIVERVHHMLIFELLSEFDIKDQVTLIIFQDLNIGRHLYHCCCNILTELACIVTLIFLFIICQVLAITLRLLHICDFIFLYTREIVIY